MGLFGSLQPDPSGYLMNLGQRQQPQDMWQAAMQPTQQQASQQFQQQYGQPIGDMQPQQLQADPRVGHAINPGFFGKGGMGSKIGVGILGGLADGLAQWGGAPPGYRNAMQQKREEDQFRQKLEAERQMRLDVMQNKVQQPNALQRNIEYLKSLNPKMSDQEAYGIARQSMVRPITIGGDVYDPTQLGPQEGGQEGGSPYTVGQTATNPQTGERIQWNGTEWVPAK